MFFIIFTKIINQPLKYFSYIFVCLFTLNNTK